jgi:hypothetical protein
MPKSFAVFSQKNSEVDIAAPGVSIASTYTNGRYTYLAGTSMATPHVAGVAALLWSAVPDATAAEIRAAIENTAKDFGIAGRDDSYGFGLVQAKEALDYLTKDSGSPPAPTIPAPTIPAPAPTPIKLPTPTPTPADNEDGDFVELRNSEGGTMCFELSNADTSDGNLIWLNTCNGTPEQKWKFDSNGYIRSALDQSKCVVGSGGYTQKGTILMIYTCYENDSRFLLSRFTDYSLRPKLALSQCVGASRSRQSTEGNYFVQFWDCHGGDHQMWQWENVPDEASDSTASTKDEDSDSDSAISAGTTGNSFPPEAQEDSDTSEVSDPELSIQIPVLTSSASKQATIPISLCVTMVMFSLFK